MASSNDLPHVLFATTLADLAAVHVAPLQDGTRCWVDSVQQNFYLSRTTSLATDGVDVIVPVAQAIVGTPANTRWLSELVVGTGTGGADSASASLLTDQAALASAVFAQVPDLSVTMNGLGDGFLDIEYDITASSSTDPAVFRATVDGVEAVIGAARVTRTQLAGIATVLSVSASARIPITAGNHVVTVEYSVAGGALTIEPVSLNEHATLKVQFVPV